MRIGYIKLVGYIGIYNGLGLYELEIDFSKSKYRKVVIKGSNASGKSTLRKALHIMPDSNNNLIPGMECRKEIVLIDKDVVYNIQIVHPINGKKERATTKAYIQKSSPEGFIELNPNGNISSYKETISDELSLDPNFITLSQLSIQNNGLATLKPSERKKFATTLINSTSSYNDMYKAFSKKSNIYRSMRNSILAKINNIGDKDKLIVTLNSIEERHAQLEQQKDIINSEISKKQTQIQMLDKDNEIQNKFKDISTEVKEINKRLEDDQRKLSVAIKKIDENISKENIQSFYQALLLKQSEFEMVIKVNQSKIDSMLIDRENEAKHLQELNGKLQSLESENMSKTKLKTSLVDCNKNIDYYIKVLNNMKIRNINDISKEEFVLALDTIHDIQDMVAVVKDEYNYDILEASIDYIKNSTILRTDFSEIDNIDIEIDKLKQDMLYYKELIRVANVLSDRPEECNIDSCPLIKDAIEANILNPQKSYNECNERLNELYSLKDNLLLEKERNMSIVMCSKTISTIMRNIERNTNIIRKLLLDERFMDSNRVLELITNSDIFKEVSTIYKYLDAANTIDLYKAEIKKATDIQHQLNIIGEKESITNDIVNQVKYIQDKLNSTTDEIDKMNKEIIDAKNNLSTLKSVILEVQYIISLYETLEINTQQKEKLLSEFETIKDSIKTIKESVNDIERLGNQLININNELRPLSNERDKIKYSIKMYDEYYAELEEYNKKYEIIETLKKFSSPTSGIQTIFINLYMNKTLSLANQLLQLMFNGKYVLYPFIINEQEFRIPCLGSGIMNDDISSMSTSETCMISMIISFAMLQQASTEYNILALDEIDAGLDTNNRLTFLYVLEELIRIMNVEQCFIISHNNELNLNDCDVIVLRVDDQYYNNEGNVIYRYQL